MNRAERWHSGLAVAMAMAMALATGVASAAGLDTYREFTLGMSPAEVVVRTAAAERDIRTLHTQPALLQTLSWRAPFVVGRVAADRESVRGIVFSFVDGRLFRIAVEYDRAVTQGLTGADMIASLTAVYGDPVSGLRRVVRRPRYDVVDAPVVLAQWGQADAVVTLQQMAYSGNFSLNVTSMPLELQAQRAEAAAATAAGRDAPAREAARLKDRAEAAKAAAERLRNANKADFRP